VLYNKKGPILDEILQNADKIKELGLRLLEIKERGYPLTDEYEELAYKYLVETESAGDARSRELYADEYRKEKEVEHRLRIDKRGRELMAKIREIDAELKKLNLEIDNLKEKKIPLEVKAGLTASQLLKERFTGLKKAADEAGDEY
jgi:hypothetical protein